MNLEGVASYLQTKRVGEMGRTIFVNEMPLEVIEGVLLRDRYSGTPIDHELPGYRATGFRAGIRSRDFTRGKNLAWQIHKALTIMTDTEMPGMIVRQMLPLNEPRPYRRSKGGYWEWEIDLDTTYVLV